MADVAQNINPFENAARPAPVAAGIRRGLKKVCIFVDFGSGFGRDIALPN
jgi:hypothetical protein